MVFNSIVNLDFDKDDASVVYGKYEIVYGIAIYGDGSTMKEMYEWSTSFILEEPVYDFGEETVAEEDILHTELAFKNTELDETLNDLDIGGYGYFSIYAQYESTNFIHVTDKLKIFFHTDAPSSLFTETSYLMQYMQLLVDGNEVEDGVTTVTCVTTSDSHTVANYESTVSIKDDKTSSVWNQLGEYRVEENGTFVESGNDYDYESWSYDQNTAQSCVAVMEIPKIDRDEDIFQRY